MASKIVSEPTSDVAILSRLIRPEENSLTPEAAESLLRIKFEQHDLDRMHELAVKNQDGVLTRREKREMENYRRVGFLLDLMHSKARLALKKQRPVLQDHGGQPHAICPEEAIALRESLIAEGRF